MYIARILYPVKVLGPGNRIGIWMAGCAHKCPGCSNPELWDTDEKYRITLQSVRGLIDSICASHPVDGVTVTGGDPFYRASDLKELLQYLSGLTDDILVYTGYSCEEICADYPWALKMISVLIDGKYEERLNRGSALRGSDNQRILFIKKEYEDTYKEYMASFGSRIQNFMINNSVVSVGIHLPDYESELEARMPAKGLMAEHGGNRR